MGLHLLLALFITIAINLIYGLKLETLQPEGLNLREVYQKAEAKVDEKWQMRMMRGYSSKKQNSHRKADSYSMEMMNRNDIFKDITDHLKANFQMKEADARALAKQALVENRNLGTDLRPDTIKTMSDMCSNIEPVCNNGPFRSITGQCNNLEVPYWGSFEAPFYREIGVGI